MHCGVYSICGTFWINWKVFRIVNKIFRPKNIKWTVCYRAAFPSYTKCIGIVCYHAEFSLHLPIPCYMNEFCKKYFCSALRLQRDVCTRNAIGSMLLDRLCNIIRLILIRLIYDIIWMLCDIIIGESHQRDIFSEKSQYYSNPISISLSKLNLNSAFTVLIKISNKRKKNCIFSGYIQ